MNPLAFRRARLRLTAIVGALGVLAGCSAQPDVSAIVPNAGIQRHDVIQTLAANERTVIGGTQAGALLVSTDAGRTWARKMLGGASLIDSARCADGSFVALDFYRKVWAVAADGSSATPAAFEEPGVPLAITCDPRGGWWVVGTHSQIAHSPDQGKSWTVSELGEDTQITTIQFVDDTHAFAMGEFGMVVVSTDGGATWSRKADAPGEFYPYAALFANREQGWMSGIAGQILATSDGGNSWKRQTNNAGVALYRLFMHGGVPHGVGAGGVVARLERDTWQPVAYPDQLPVFFGSGASLPGQSALIAGSPGGLVRVIGTKAN